MEKNLKRVGILTFHRAVNYGAILQSYALQQQLRKLGLDCEIIDYRCKAIENPYSPFSINKNEGILRKVKSIAGMLFKWRGRQRKRRMFYRFLQTHMTLTSSYRNSHKLIGLNSKFDLFISGSDQVWNHNCTKLDPAYFLDFVQDINKKNSYAASFGFTEIPKSLRKTYWELLHPFHHISVRERSGVKIIHDLLNREASFNLDPTLLLSRLDWNKLASSSDQFQNYILLYILMDPSKILNVAFKIAEQKNLKIIYLNEDSLGMKIRHPNIVFLTSATPEEFLSLFQNARYVLTNSFHGTAFSIIFQKQFMVEIAGREGNKNNRSESLLNLLGLNERIMDGSAWTQIDQIIDWVTVNERLEREREKSIQYLRQLTS